MIWLGFVLVIVIVSLGQWLAVRALRGGGNALPSFTNTKIEIRPDPTLLSTATEARPWSMWVLVPAALLTFPGLMFLLVAFAPHGPSTNGSVPGLFVLPFASAAVVWFLNRHAAEGGARSVVTTVAVVGALFWCGVALLGMLVG